VSARVASAVVCSWVCRAQTRRGCNIIHKKATSRH